MTRLIPLLLLAAAAGSAQIPNSYPIFDKDAVHEIKLTFPNEDWFQVLTDNYDGVRAENPYFTASLEWGDYKFESVGVRFKGNSTYSAARGNKKPFRIKLNEFVKGQKIDGIGSFSLSNGWNDPSFVREKVYYEMAASLGLKAPRSNFAALYINGTYWGLYILTEVINSDFLKNYFGKGQDEGNLYKGNIGASFAYLGEDKEAYKQAWEKQSNEDADDWTDLIALCRLINDTPASELKSVLEPVMDVDSVLTALALDNATVNLDSYVGMGQNFNVYRRPSDNRWVWIPWDPSLAFGALSQGQSIDGMKQLALEWVNAGGFGGGGLPPGGNAQAGRPLATKLWEVPEYKQRYRQIYQNLVEKVFLQDKVLARMNELRDMIRPWVERDTQKLVTMEQFEGAMTTDAVGSNPGGDGLPPGGGGPGGGGPGGGGPGGGGPGGGGPGGGGPGGGGPGGGGIPGLNGLVEGRLAFLTSKLAEEAVPTMVLGSDQSSIALSQTASGTAASQTVTLSLNGTDVPASYSVYGTTESGGAWLTIAPANGGAPGSFKVSNGGKLAAGTYNGTIRIYSPGAVNSPLIVPVTLTITQ